MYCVECGGSNVDGTTYCVSCGSTLSGEQQQTVTVNSGNNIGSDGYRSSDQGGKSGSEPPVSFKEWLLTIFIANIPLVNIIMLFVWGFGSGNSNKSKSNWSKAMLAWVAISVAVNFLMFLGIIALLGAAFGAVADGLETIINYGYWVD